LDDISNILQDLNAMSAVMGREVDRQTEQLKQVTDKVDLANERMFYTNQRVDRLNNS
jgi:uncharacterized coiled-coil protein SlyX